MKTLFNRDNPESFEKHLASSEKDEILGMVCTGAGYMEVGPGTPPAHEVRPIPPERTSREFLIVYICKGSGAFTTEGAAYTSLPGSLLFIYPGMRYQYRPDAGIGCAAYWVSFKGGFFTKLLENKLLSSEHIFLEIGIRVTITALFNQIIEEVQTEQPLYQVKICSSILALIAEIMAFPQRENHLNPRKKIVEEAKYLISLSLHKKKMSIGGVAKKIGVSGSKLNELFKVVTAMTPYQYGLQLKIDEAKLLLENGNQSLRDISRALGFRDQGHFSKLFKQKTGVTPFEWREMLTRSPSRRPEEYPAVPLRYLFIR
ncbi:MAG: AraC family transcriptional regulator [Treponema sp.]|jgi:AraC-like DNA-binding protein|nr:AraC family transcriptional regulator [Treponema sp.]